MKIATAIAFALIIVTASVNAGPNDSVVDRNASVSLIPAVTSTVVRLRDFTVTRDKKRILLAWQTTFDAGNLGFNLYREISGQKAKVNKQLIGGAAFQSKQHADAGHAYR